MAREAKQSRFFCTGLLARFAARNDAEGAALALVWLANAATLCARRFRRVKPAVTGGCGPAHLAPL